MNKVMLIGNVGKDPEVRYIDNGVCTAKVALATNTPGYTLPNGTQVPDRAEWHNLLFWRKLAEVVERYVHKGDKLYVEGELRTRNYTDHQGVVRYIPCFALLIAYAKTDLSVDANHTSLGVVQTLYMTILERLCFIKNLKL